MPFIVPSLTVGPVPNIALRGIACLALAETDRRCQTLEESSKQNIGGEDNEYPQSNLVVCV